jgi:hypothetical protein
MAASTTLIPERAARAAEHDCRIASADKSATKSLPFLFLAAAAVSCLVQFLWFYRSCIHNIDFDGMGYVGIARHVVDGNFAASINAFRSPLISWLIACLSPSPDRLVLAGKIVTIASFVAAEVLLYVFTVRLWKSRLTAAIAVLWFSLGRGIFAFALLLVSPDYLFAALTLMYFILLESCLRSGRKQTWFYLGCVHGLAYLAKAFALPWLAVITALMALFSRNSNQQKLSYLGLAAIAPVIAVAGWGSILHARYGVFTTGSQFKTNIMQWTLHQDLSPHTKGYELLTDTSEAADSYMVVDPMPPHSSAWSFRLTPGRLFPQIMRSELRNIPRALKEIAVVVTPGGCLLVVFGLFAFRRWGEKYRNQLSIVAIVALSSLALVVAYCMMIFDERYVLPIVPLIIAAAAGLLLSPQSPVSRRVRFVCAGLIVAGLLFTFFYKASPFRTLTRDFESSCIDAGNKLRAYPQARVITLGEGPFPEHGIGWEAGYKAAFFGGARVVATAPRIANNNLEHLESDIRKSAADALMLWGDPRDRAYQHLIADLSTQYPGSRLQPIHDPERGQVGSILELH